MTNLLLDSREFRLLDGLRLNPRKRFSGRVRGERMTQTKGVSIEFADYREYAEGDDLRHLDWNVLARLGHPVTKTYRDEEDLAVHLLLDGSTSMSFGEPTKWQTACGLAAAAGFIALTSGDAVFPRLLGTRQEPIGVLRGRAGFPRFAAWANSAKVEGVNALDADIRAFASSGARAGLVVLVSDGLHPAITQSVRVLAGRGHEVWMIQVLSDTEIDPDLEGDLRLIDAENTQTAEVTINSFTLNDYRKNLRDHNQALSDEALRTGGKYSLVVAGTALDKVVRDVWKREGWVS